MEEQKKKNLHRNNVEEEMEDQASGCKCLGNVPWEWKIDVTYLIGVSRAWWRYPSFTPFDSARAGYPPTRALLRLAAAPRLAGYVLLHVRDPGALDGHQWFYRSLTLCYTAASWDRIIRTGYSWLRVLDPGTLDGHQWLYRSLTLCYTATSWDPDYEHLMSR